LGDEGAEVGAGAMLVTYRLAGLSALEAYYAGVVALTQSGDSFSDVILRLAASQ